MEEKNNAHSDFTPLQCAPVDSPEPRMHQHIVCTPDQVSKPFSTIGMEECLYQVAREGIDVGRPVNFALEDLFVYAKGVIVVERLHRHRQRMTRSDQRTYRIPDQHLIAQNPTCPPIYRLAVSIALNNFRSQILWGAAERPRTVIYHLCEAKVCDAQVPAMVEEQVLGL